MKKALLIFITFLSINTINAQEKIEKYYNYAKGNIKEAGAIDKNGFPIGEWNYYLDSGALGYIINWETNFSKEFYETGELKVTRTFNPDTGASIGESITYFKNGKIELSGNYDNNGDKNGVFKTFFKNGTLKNIQTYINGKLQ